jgi:beta-galactosidase
MSPEIGGWIVMLIQSLFLACSVVLQPAAQSPGSAIWIEGESAKTVVGAKIDPTGSRAGMLSGDRWMSIGFDKENLPKDGVTLSYPVPVTRAGSYRLWARVGFEWVRADLAYRVDGGAWVSMPASQATTNVMELAAWNEVAWQRGDPVNLAAGNRNLDVRFTTPDKGERFLFGLDCIALVPVDQDWTPEGTLKPGEKYDEAIDRDAAAKSYTVSIPAAGARVETPLNDLWEVARADDPNMDVETYDAVRSIPAGLTWRGIKVPSDAWAARPDLGFAHRLVYRTRVNVPADLAGRGFLLRFGGHAWITSVFVNGKFVSDYTGTLVPFDVDLTRHLRTGETNVLEVAVKGAYYAIDHQPGQLMRSRNQPRNEEFLKYVKWIDCTWPTGKGGGEATSLGITRPVSLVVTGKAYTTETFIRTSVKNKRLAADITVQNSALEPATLSVETVAVNDKTGEVEKRFAPRPLRLEAGASGAVAIDESWENPKLWWPAESIDDKPTCYRLRTTLTLNGAVIDTHETLFGFRELEVDGRHVRLNGVPWRPHSWNALGGATGQMGGMDLESYFRWNDRGVRMEGGVHTDFYDRNGIPGRLSMTWEGMFGQVAMENPRMWTNWKRHVEQMIRAYRNSPSVWHWSIGNEVQMITARLFFGDRLGRLERQMNELFVFARQLDPTRTVSEDGAGDLGGLGDSSNWHYVVNEFKLPRQFYEYELGEPSAKREYVDYQTLNRWDGQRPLIQGEEMYYAGMGNFAWFGGPSVYRGKQQRDLAGGKYARIYTEGARWQDVFQVHACAPPLPGVEQAMAARAVFVKDTNAAHYPGSTVNRSVKVFNDTRTDQTLTLRWRLMLGTRVADRGEKPVALKAGENREDRLQVKVPSFSGDRADGKLVLELFSGSQRVFADEKPFDILPVRPAVQVKLGLFAVWDPGDVVRPWLQGRKQPMVIISSLEALPTTAKVVLVGPNAITEENRADVARRLKAFVAQGNTAIVLEQSVPLKGDDLPLKGIMIADREKGQAARPEWEKVGGHTGGIAHPMAAAHPVLANITADDLFTWAGDDQLNYRLSYATAPTGVINLIQAGEDLTLAPMFEVVAGRGSYLLSQMLIGEKLGKEPTADRLLQNALTWATARGEAKPRRTLVFSGGDAELDAMIQRLGIDFVGVSAPADVLAKDSDIAVVRATPPALQALVTQSAAVKAFAERGGWLMLVGLDQAGLAAFNRLVGFEHRIRPFQKESVLLEAMLDPLAMGISDRDLQQVDPEVIAPWMGLQRVSGKVFSAVVDAGDNLAPFVDLGAFREGTDRPLTDGLTGEIFWRYTQYLSSSGTESITMKLDRPERLAAVDIWQSDAYFWAKDVEVLVDGKPVKPFVLKNAIGWQTVDLGGVQGTEVVIRFTSTYPATRQITQPLITIDEVRLRRVPPPGFESRVVALAAPGGLVKYPMGKGGIVLNQVRYDQDDLPENLAKKKILFSSLLRNLGVSFRQ